MEKEIVVALAGNPNTGKTSIFNAMVGAKQHVANYPGVTVEKKEGNKKYGEYNIKVVDLPGTYSLTAYSIEEIITRDFILNEKPDIVLNIIDSSNLERNLYLTIQLLEMNAPVIIALNMTDELEAMGMTVDAHKFEKITGSPVVQTIGNRGIGVDLIFEKIVQTLNSECSEKLKISYGRSINAELEKLQYLLQNTGDFNLNIPSRWAALKLLENDSAVLEKIEKLKDANTIILQLKKSVDYLEKNFDDSLEVVIAERRYGYISGIFKEAVIIKAERRKDISEKIDLVLTNRLLGIPIFLLMMYLVFYVTFTFGELPMGWIETVVSFISDKISLIWPVGKFELLKSLVIDGIIGGVGGVIIFLPNILILFFGIALLEDTGYMARAAFLMDRAMKWVGLHGKSFIPMLTGFGCSVPAIMATRCLDNEKDRLTTILVLPLMSCGARLPIYTLIIPAFFSDSIQPIMMWLIYVIGILLAIVSAKLLKNTLFKGETSPFVMELPPYRIPTLKSVVLHMYERAMMYIKKAGTVILGFSVLMWVLTTFPKPSEDYINNQLLMRGYNFEQNSDILTENNKDSVKENLIKTIELEYTAAGRIGKNILAPVLKPLGFDWKIGTALIGALAAKELFVSQLGIVYSIDSEEDGEFNLRQILRKNYSKLTAFCIMLFCLISAPCMSTIAMTMKETNSFKWGFFQLAGLTLLAYIITFIIYQTGYFLRLGVY